MIMTPNLRRHMLTKQAGIIVALVCLMLLSIPFCALLAHHFQFSALKVYVALHALTFLLGAVQFSGGSYVNTTFSGDRRCDIQSNLLTQIVSAGWTNVAQATGQGPGNVGTVTITIASPGVVTFTAHGFLGAERVILQVSTGGALPTGLSVNTVYFVKYIDANTFNLATTSGGSNINTSGSQSGTITLNAESVLLQSATQTNVTNPIRMRLKDELNNCLHVTLENQAGTKIGAGANSGGHLLPATSKTFRIIATKYWFSCFTTTSINTSREFVYAGMLFVPSFVASVTDHGIMLSGSVSDSSGNFPMSFRHRPALDDNGVTYYVPNYQFLWNTSLIDQAGGTTTFGTGYPAILITGASRTYDFRAATHYRWANDNINTADVLLSIGLTAHTDEGKIKGQFFDMIYIADAFAADATDTFNSHNWLNLTSNFAGDTTAVRGGMWVATS